MSGIAPATNTRAVLDLDPDLATGLAEDELAQARRACQGAISRINPGIWDSLPEMRERQDVVGCLIVDGLLCREVALREGHMLELLGDGDVVVPPAPAEWPRLASKTTVTAIVPTLVVVLGPSFARAAASWPQLLVNLHRRLEDQRERLAIQGLIGHVPQAEHRLLLQLWHLGTRWGRVTPDGIRVPFQLTHDLLGQLIAARRPTVTLAARRLEAHDQIRRESDGTWLLTEGSERAVKALIGTRDARVVGETLMTRQRSAELRKESEALRAEALGTMRIALARRRNRDRS